MTVCTLRDLLKRTAVAMFFGMALLGAAAARANGPEDGLRGPVDAVNAQPSTESGDETVARTAAEYQVEFRHPTETNNEWRVSVLWTTDYTYAKACYDYLVGLKKYDVRMYKRGGS